MKRAFEQTFEKHKGIVNHMEIWSKTVTGRETCAYRNNLETNEAEVRWTEYR